jgi:hypothetical protein
VGNYPFGASESTLTLTEKTVTSDYSVTGSDCVIIGNSALSITVTLPTAVGAAGRVYVVKSIGNGVVTVATTGGQTIDGNSSVGLGLYQSIAVQSDGANWWIVSTEGFAWILSVSGAAFLAALTVTAPAVLNGGTDTSGTATASSPSFVSGTAQQLSTSQDVTLYIAVQTSAALAVAIGPTSTPANTIMPSRSYALGMATVHVPKGWYVEITGTIADLTITAVTC